MVKVFRPSSAFRRSRSVLRTAYCVFSVYDEWVHELAVRRQYEMRRDLLIQHGYGDYATQRAFGKQQERTMQDEYDMQRQFQYASSECSSISAGSDMEEEKLDEEDEEDEDDPVRFRELPSSEEEGAFEDLRHFIQRQTQRAEMERAYGQRFEALDPFDQAQRERSFNATAFPPMTQ